MTREIRQESGSIGARVASLRKERGITQVELAHSLGVSQPVISEYERGSVALRGDQIAALARLLNVSADHLLGLRTARAAATRDTRLARRIRELEQLPRRDRDALLRTIDAFLVARAPSPS